MAGLWDGKTMQLEELHRFPNGAVEIAGTLRWDVLRLWAEIQDGLAIAGQRFGDAIVSIGVDTWGVDYVLLSKTNELLGLPFTYRDSRTRGLLADNVCARAEDARSSRRPACSSWRSTRSSNCSPRSATIPRSSRRRIAFLMIPDFLHWCLTGVRVVEFTNATTTQFCNPATRGWATGLLGALGLPDHFLPPIIEPGTKLGGLRKSVAQRTGIAARASPRSRHARHRLRRRGRADAPARAARTGPTSARAHGRCSASRCRKRCSRPACSRAISQTKAASTGRIAF